MLINHRRFWDQEPPKEEFAYTVEEVAFTHGGVEYFADVTYSLFVGWEYTPCRLGCGSDPLL